MPLERRVAAVQRGLLLTMLVGSIVVFWNPALDGVHIAKITVIVVGFVLLAASQVARTGVLGRAEVPWSPFTAATAAFIAALVIATAVSDVVEISVAGTYKRYTGLVSYAVYALSAAAATRRFDRRSIDQLAWTTLVAAAVVVLYGLMQWSGNDPFPWQRLYGEAVFSTLGNPNFASALCGVSVPVALWAAVSTKHPAALRGTAALVGVGALFVAWRTGSTQGFVAAAGGVAVFALAWIRTLGDRLRRTLTWTWIGGALLGGVAVAAGIVGVGPVARILAAGTLELRGYYWRSAWNMFADNPLFGVGLDMFAGQYRRYRPVEAAVSLDITQFADDPHNVVLNMLAEGGLVLGLAYVAVVVVTAAALVAGMRRLSGDRLLLLGGVGGAWLAYQVQSLVSIDVPPLAFLHWMLAGGVVVLGWEPSTKVVALPWAPPPPSKKGRKPARVSPVVRRVAVGAAVALAVLGTWAATLPLRADHWAGRAGAWARGDVVEQALANIDRSIDIAPWQAMYRFERGKILVDAERAAEALDAMEAAAARDPYDLGAVVTAARAADAIDADDRAAHWYGRALHIEPHDPQLKLEAARFFLQRGEEEQARQLLADVVRVDPDNEEAKELLATTTAGSS